MKNEDILEAARKEKDKGNEYENKVFIKSGLLGAAVALFIGIILFLIEYYVKGTYNWGFMLIVFAGHCADLLFQGIKTRKGWRIILGAICGIIALLLTFAFACQMVTK